MALRASLLCREEAAATAIKYRKHAAACIAWNSSGKQEVQTADSSRQSFPSKQAPLYTPYCVPALTVCSTCVQVPTSDSYNQQPPAAAAVLVPCAQEEQQDKTKQSKAEPGEGGQGCQYWTHASNTFNMTLQLRAIGVPPSICALSEYLGESKR